jgi:hypothetical protein
MTDEEIKQELLTKLVVPLWPTAGLAVGLSRSATYQAAKRGDIPTLDVGRNRTVPTASLRKMLGIESTRKK